MTSIMKRLMKWWITRDYGSRCSEYDKGCPTCEAWKAYDYLFDLDTLIWDSKTLSWKYPVED